MSSIRMRILSLGPSTSSSTRPSSRFLTPPQSPRCDATRAANARYPTPWTFPFTNSLARRAAGSIGSAIDSDRPRVTNDAYPTNGYSHTSAEASRVLRFRASEFRTTVLERKMEMLDEIRCTPALSNFSNARAREPHEGLLERLLRSEARTPRNEKRNS